MPRRILVVEDDPDIARLIAMQLREIDCQAQIVDDGTEGLRVANAGDHDLVILDLMLPGTDGLSICRQLRQRKNYVPVLMLTAKSSEIDRVLGLEIGADDYLTKPFSVLELSAPVKAQLRRVDALSQPAAAEEVVVRGDLRIDPDRRRVTIGERDIELTAKEFDLLLYFARHPGRVFSRSQLLDKVWGYSHAGYEHTVNSHINRLRAKIETEPHRPAYIVTVWGVGYQFAEQTG